MKQHDATTADLVVLALLAEQPKHGYDLIRAFQAQEVAEWAHVSRAHVYYALKQLAVKKYIEADRTEPPESTRGKTVFRITKPGLKILESSLGDPRWITEKIPAPFTTWLGLAIHARPEKVREMLLLRVEFLENEIKRKQIALEFTRSYPSPRAKMGLVMIEIYLEQLAVELRILKSLKTELENSND